MFSANEHKIIPLLSFLLSIFIAVLHVRAIVFDFVVYADVNSLGFYVFAHFMVHIMSFTSHAEFPTEFSNHFSSINETMEKSGSNNNSNAFSSF